MKRDAFLRDIIFTVIILLIEYLIIQPFVKSTIGILVLSGLLLVFLVYEYHYNKVFPKIGFTQYREIVDTVLHVARNWLFVAVSIVGLVVRELAQFVAYVFVVFTLGLTFAFAVLPTTVENEAVVFQRWTGYTFVGSGVVWVTVSVLFILLPLVTKALDEGERLVSRSVVIFSLTLLVLWNIDNTYTNYLTPLAKQIVLSDSIIALTAIWVVSLGVLYVNSKNCKSLEREMAFVTNIPEIADWVERESDRLVHQLQGEWKDFVNDPFADDYIDSIRNCVPVKCEGYTVVMGYVTNLERRVLSDVQNALEEDMRAYFGLPYLKIRFERIDAELHSKLLNMIYAD